MVFSAIIKIGVAAIVIACIGYEVIVDPPKDEKRTDIELPEDLATTFLRWTLQDGDKPFNATLVVSLSELQSKEEIVKFPIDFSKVSIEDLRQLSKLGKEGIRALVNNELEKMLSTLNYYKDEVIDSFWSVLNEVLKDPTPAINDSE